MGNKNNDAAIGKAEIDLRTLAHQYKNDEFLIALQNSIENVLETVEIESIELYPDARIKHNYDDITTKFIEHMLEIRKKYMLKHYPALIRTTVVKA